MPSWELSLAAANAGLGAAQQVAQGTLKPDAACLDFVNLLRNFREVHSISQDGPFVWKKKHCRRLGWAGKMEGTESQEITWAG